MDTSGTTGGGPILGLHNFAALDKRIIDAITASEPSPCIDTDTVVLVNTYDGTVKDNPGTRNDHFGSSAVILRTT